jgi:hypothetical protein
VYIGAIVTVDDIEILVLLLLAKNKKMGSGGNNVDDGVENDDMTV